MTVRKIRILSKAFRDDGARGVVEILVHTLKANWRRGEVWQLGRFLGMPTDIVRLDGCRFTIEKQVVPANVIELLLSGRYEHPERQALKRFLDPRWPVVELGGCVGVISCLANRRLREPDRHVVVEANPALLPILRQNREQNGCHFEIVHAALAHGAGTITLNVNDDILASSVHREARRAVVVPTITLKRVLDEHRFERATLICDIEGAEVELVEEEIETLRERVIAIIMELHDRVVGEAPTARLLARLEGAGFRMVEKTGDVVVLQKERGSVGSVATIGAEAAVTPGRARRPP